MEPSRVAHAGSLFAVLVFAHFVVDWIFQTHWEAMRKHDHAGARAVHCTIYTFGMSWALWIIGLAPGTWPFAVATGTIFLSHFIEDTYVPVYLWARYIRRVPELVKDGRSGFHAFVDTPLGGFASK